MNDAHTRRPDRKVRSGFSLVELVVSLAVITLVATLAIPSFFNRSAVSLENAAVLLTSDLRSAQNRAAYLATEVRVHFAQDGSGYWIDDVVSSSETGLHVIERNYPENAVFEGVVVEDVKLESSGDLTFHPRGIPSTAARITLSYLSDTRIITVKAKTGRLEIEGSTSGWVDNGY